MNQHKINVQCGSPSRNVGTPFSLMLIDFEDLCTQWINQLDVPSTPKPKSKQQIEKSLQGKKDAPQQPATTTSNNKQKKPILRPTQEGCLVRATDGKKKISTLVCFPLFSQDHLWLTPLIRLRKKTWPDSKDSYSLYSKISLRSIWGRRTKLRNRQLQKRSQQQRMQSHKQHRKRLSTISEMFDKIHHPQQQKAQDG